eukprot:15210-Heterococcus_DN1.PRE.1
MVRELEKVHGPVLHVVLPTLAIEHKGPFSRQFPQSQAWVMPGQYSYPINLPTQWLGFGSKPIKLLPESAVGAPWEKEVRTVPRNIPKSLDHALLGPLLSRDGIGAYGEATFLYKPTGTLLVTDVVIQYQLLLQLLFGTAAVVHATATAGSTTTTAASVNVVDEDIPAIVELGDPRALLFHARDDALQLIEDTPQIRTKGWKRIQQFGLFFQPSSLEVEPLGQALLKTAPKSPMKELGWFGLFPFTWGGASLEESSYRALQGGLVVAPILQTLILNRQPKEVLKYADTVARWPIKRLISCHLGNNVPSSGAAFRSAFRFLEDDYVQPTRNSAPLFRLQLAWHIKNAALTSIVAYSNSCHSGSSRCAIRASQLAACAQHATTTVVRSAHNSALAAKLYAFLTPQSGTTASTGSNPLQQLLSAIGLAPKAVAVASLPQAAPLEEDLEFLRIAEKNLVKIGTINPAEPRVPIQKSAVLAVDRKQ